MIRFPAKITIQSLLSICLTLCVVSITDYRTSVIKRKPTGTDNCIDPMERLVTAAVEKITRDTKEAINRDFQGRISTFIPKSLLTTHGKSRLKRHLKEKLPFMAKLIDNTNDSDIDLFKVVTAIDGIRNTLFRDLSEMELSLKEMEVVKRNLAKFEGKSFEENMDFIKALKFMRNQKSKNFGKGLDQITEGILNPTNGVRSFLSRMYNKPFYRKYINFKRSMNTSERIRSKFMVRGKNNQISKRLDTISWRLNRETKVMACKSNRAAESPAQKLAFSRFSTYQSIAGLTLYPGVYTWKEWERISNMWGDERWSWLGWEYGREIGTNLLATAAVILVFKGQWKNPVLNQINKNKFNQYLGLYSLYSVVGLSDPLGFNHKSDAYDQRAEKFMEDVAKHPDFEKILLEFKVKIEREFELVDFKEDLKTVINGQHGREAFLNRMNKFIEDSGLFPDADSQQRAKTVFREGVQDQGEDPLLTDAGLTQEEKDRLDAFMVSDKISNQEEWDELKFMIALFYYEQIAGLIHTGNVGWDRYWHSRVYTLGSTVKDLIIGSTIFQLFCVNGFKPLPIIMASGLTLGNILGFSALFVDTRGSMLNKPVEEAWKLDQPIHKFVMELLTGPKRTWYDEDYEAELEATKNDNSLKSLKETQFTE